MSGNITEWTKNNRRYNSLSLLYNEETEWIFLRLKYFFEEETEIPVKKIPRTIHFHRFNTGDWFGKHDDNKCERSYGIGVLLNSNFSGGDFKFYKGEEICIGKEPGNSYIFDVRIQHEVLPITEGERYSLLYFLHRGDLNIISRNII